MIEIRAVRRTYECGNGMFPGTVLVKNKTDDGFTATLKESIRYVLESQEMKWNCVNCLRFRRETIEVKSIARPEHPQWLCIPMASSFPFATRTPVSHLTLKRVGGETIIENMQVHAGWTYIVREIRAQGHPLTGAVHKTLRNGV